MDSKITRFIGEFEFLSNFSYSSILPPTLEHHYQARKTLNETEQLWIMNSPTPAIAKHRGRKITLRADWEELKLPIMAELVRLKFRPPALSIALIGTGDRELIEGNFWHDNFWGSCFCERRTCETVVHHNYLGTILMSERSDILNKYGK